MRLTDIDGITVYDDFTPDRVAVVRGCIALCAASVAAV
jgi:hypothetical protein